MDSFDRAFQSAYFARMKPRFDHWYAGQDPRTGRSRVVADGGRVVCNDCTVEDANDIAVRHNAADPIKSREDWLWYRSGS
jgi:hypothetical protein